MEKNLIMNLSFTPPTTHSHLFFIHTDLSNFSPKSLLIVQIKFMSIKYVSLHIKKKIPLKRILLGTTNHSSRFFKFLLGNNAHCEIL